MEGEMVAPHIGGLDSAIAFGFRIVGPETLPDVLSLCDPSNNPQLRVALEPSKESRFGRIVLKPADQNDPWHRFEKVVRADGTFELINRHSGWSITISHLSQFLVDPSYFHPRVRHDAARWKAAVVKNATGEVAAGVVCSSALQSECLVLKIAQPGDGRELADEVVVMQPEDDDGDGAAATGERTSTTLHAGPARGAAAV